MAHHPTTRHSTSRHATLQRSLFRQVNRVVEPALRLGVGAPPPLGAGVVVLETIGRRSNLPRSTPLLSLRLGSTLVAATIRPSSDWVANIEARPATRLRVGRRSHAATSMVRRLPMVSVATFELT